MTRRQPMRRIPVRLPQMETPQGSWLRGVRLSGFTLSVLFLIVSALVVLAPSLKILIEQQQTVAALEQELEEKENSVGELEGEVARWSDPAYIESQARSRLYYVYPGEISYMVIDDGQSAATPDGLPVSDELQATQVDWLQAMLSSVVTAGLTDASPDQLQAPVMEGAP